MTDRDLTSEERWPTMHRLAHDLDAAGAPAEMVQKALSGFYDDYHPNGHPMNMNMLVVDMRAAGMPQIMITKVMNGEWDATKQESDAWAESEEGQEAFAEFPPEMVEKLFGAKKK